MWWIKRDTHTHTLTCEGSNVDIFIYLLKSIKLYYGVFENTKINDFFQIIWCKFIMNDDEKKRFEKGLLKVLKRSHKK